MGLFGRKRSSPEAGAGGSNTRSNTPRDSDPPTRGECACPEHVDQLLELPVPLTREMREEFGDEPLTVGQLVEMGALGVDPAQDRYFFDPRSGRRDDGPYHWTVWFGDETRACYDDDAPVQLDESLDDRPGIELVAWEDREVIHVGAPGLCEDGVLAAAARALIDPRVRLPED
jgi:hypothetical protein